MNAWLRNTWTTFWPGARVITELLSVKPLTPVPSVATTRRLTYSVTLPRFSAPSLKVKTLLFLDREKRWVHVACEMSGGLAVALLIVTVTLVVLLRLPLVPVTLTLPLVAVDEAVMVRVAEPEAVMLVGLNVPVSPEVPLAVRLTVPAKPPTAFTVQVLDTEPPWATLTLLGVHAIVKS